MAAKQPDIIIRENPVPVICDLTERPDPIDTQDTPPTLVLNTQTEVWGFWFDPSLYGALAENLQAMRRYMTQGRAVRAKLVACITDHNDSIRPAE